jgi:hypothetical protein
VKFTDLIQHLECCPGVAGAMRKSWGGKTYIVLLNNGNLAFVVDSMRLQYAFSFEDVIADDWEPA